MRAFLRQICPGSELGEFAMARDCNLFSARAHTRCNYAGHIVNPFDRVNGCSLYRRAASGLSMRYCSSINWFCTDQPAFPASAARQTSSTALTDTHWEDRVGSIRVCVQRPHSLSWSQTDPRLVNANKNYSFSVVFKIATRAQADHELP